MATANFTRSYDDGNVLAKSDLDAFLDDIETLLNTTGLNDDNIVAKGIGTASLGDGAVTTVKIAASAVTTAKLADDNVTGAKLAPAVAGAGLAQDGSGNLDITVDDSTIEISADTVQLKDDGVTGAKLAPAVAGSGLAQDGSGNLDITVDDSTIEINSDTVRAKDGGITRAKLATGFQQKTASSSGSFSTGSGTYVDVTNLSVTITTNGLPVLLMLTQGGSGSNSYIGNTGSGTAYFRIDRGGSNITQAELKGAGINIPPGAICSIDTPTAGTYTYKVQARIGTATTAVVNDCHFQAMEL